MCCALCLLVERNYIVALSDNDTRAITRPTVLQDAYVTDVDVSGCDVVNLSRTNHRVLRLEYELFLESLELLVLAPINDCRHEYDDNDGHQDTDTFDEARSALGRINYSNIANTTKMP